MVKKKRRYAYEVNTEFTKSMLQFHKLTSKFPYYKFTKNAYGMFIGAYLSLKDPKIIKQVKAKNHLRC